MKSRDERSRDAMAARTTISNDLYGARVCAIQCYSLAAVVRVSLRDRIDFQVFGNRERSISPPRKFSPQRESRRFRIACYVKFITLGQQPAWPMVQYVYRTVEVISDKPARST